MASFFGANPKRTFSNRRGRHGEKENPPSFHLVKSRQNGGHKPQDKTKVEIYH